MVGVPRSKGCKTCRKKKIKCDEQRPRCGQCRKGVRECEGYDQPTIFLNTSSGDFPDSSSTHSQKVIRFKNQSVEVAWVNGHETRSVSKPAVTQPKQPSRRVQPYAITRTKRAQGAETVPAPRMLDTQVWAVESILSQFLEICLPSSATQEAPLAWVGSLMTMKKDVDALPLAMSALAFGWAGHVNDQPQLVDKGLQLYNAAIQQLRNDLDTCSPLQMFAATTIFVAFELCEFGSKDNPGWQTHMQGIAALLQSLGPEMVSTNPFLQIYSFCRSIFIIQGLNRRRKVCASSPMWIEGPFRNHEKNAYQKLFDLAAEACELLECADTLERPNEMSLDDDVGIAQLAHVLHGILDIISRLKAWMRDSKISGLGGPLRFPNSHLVTQNRLDRATARGYPTKLPTEKGWTYDAVQGQRTMHLYWTVLLDLYMTILDNPVLSSLLENDDSLQAKIITELGVEKPEARRAPTALIFEECQRLANDIAVYSTSSCHNVCQSFGSLVSVYILETAIRWYERHSRDGGQMELELEQHCRAILDGIKTEEAKDPCAFEVAILPDDVLRRHWC